MSEEFLKLIKIKEKINKNKFHLFVKTNMEDLTEWELYQNFAEYDMYVSRDNHAILSSRTDTFEDLEKYLKNHNGINKERL